MRPVLIVLALLVPLPLLALLGNALADRIGRRLGTAAADVAHQLDSRTEPAVPSTLLVPLAAPTSDVSERAPAGARGGVRSAAAAGCVYVRSDDVLRLARIGALPGGVPVRAEGDRPAGLALVGVSGLGIGLTDGDILTHAGGMPARSASAVFGLVIAARGARVPQLSGRFWRRGRYYVLLVDQPYLEPRPAKLERVAWVSGG